MHITERPDNKEKIVAAVSPGDLPFINDGFLTLRGKSVVGNEVLLTRGPCANKPSGYYRKEFLESDADRVGRCAWVHYPVNNAPTTVFTLAGGGGSLAKTTTRRPPRHLLSRISSAQGAKRAY